MRFKFFSLIKKIKIDNAVINDGKKITFAHYLRIKNGDDNKIMNYLCSSIFIFFADMWRQTKIKINRNKKLIVEVTFENLFLEKLHL